MAHVWRLKCANQLTVYSSKLSLLYEIVFLTTTRLLGEVHLLLNPFLLPIGGTFDASEK